jgi:chaperonin GroEL
VEKVKSSTGNVGYNVATGVFEDPHFQLASGVVDPTKVTRSALQNAASISGLLLTTHFQMGLITELPEKKAEAGGHGHESSTAETWAA